MHPHGPFGIASPRLQCLIAFLILTTNTIPIIQAPEPFIVQKLVLIFKPWTQWTCIQSWTSPAWLVSAVISPHIYTYLHHADTSPQCQLTYLEPPVHVLLHSRLLSLNTLSTLCAAKYSKMQNDGFIILRLQKKFGSG